MSTGHESFLFSSESVTEGHPDKVSDRISDTVLDAFLEQDPESLVACETLTTTNLVVLAGEIKSRGVVRDLESRVRAAVADIGYTDPDQGFCADTLEYLDRLHEQSPDIRQGVEQSNGDVGAGDQGLMFGYACNETAEFMPLCISLSHQLTRKLAEERKSGRLPWLRPDGKSQVTVEYQGGVPRRLDTVVVSTQHSETIGTDEIRHEIKEKIITPVLGAKWLNDKIQYHINPTGRFVIGGPDGDAGLTGRKIIVDTYGGYAPHGGGAFSGKDPTKVDRSAAYYSRFVAKNLVAAGLADKALIQVAYAIGVAEPVSIHLDTFGTHHFDPAKILKAVKELFSMKPRSMIEELGLRRPIYVPTSAYGHFGRSDLSLPWEQCSKVDSLKSYFGL
jgi:S-adenosylmethionine synthetase